MKKGLILLSLLIILVFSMIISAGIGVVHIPFTDILSTLFSSDNSTNKTILLSLRLPRIIESCLVGMALSVVGVCFQGLLRNPMADPYVLGISSGAAVGATIAIIFSLGIIFTNLIAFTLAVITVFAVYIMARRGTKVDMTYMILVGVAISAFLSSLISLIMLLHHEQMSKIMYWIMGGFSYVTWVQIIISSLIIIPGCALIYFFSRELNALLIGEEAAYHLGINVEMIKKIILVLGSIITASAVSVSGIVGFVGLIIPHTVRIITGPDHKILIPVSALAGSIFLVWADTLCRVILSSTELPIGVITSAIGGPFFLYLLVKSRRTYSC